MFLSDITPFVRFVRTECNIPCGNEFVPLDNRLFYCTDGESIIEINGDKITLKKGTLVYWKAGTPYRYITRSAKVIGCNFDFTQSGKEKHMPVPPSRAGLYSEKNLFENVSFQDEAILNSYFYIEN